MATRSLCLLGVGFEDGIPGNYTENQHGRLRARGARGCKSGSNDMLCFQSFPAPERNGGIVTGDYDLWDFDESEYQFTDHQGPAGRTLALLDAERAWLDTYRARLNEQFPDLVQEVTVYGPRARGDGRPGPHLRLLIIISQGDWFQKDAVGSLGHVVDMEDFFVAPSIMVYTRDEWTLCERIGADLFQAVKNGSVRLA